MELIILGTSGGYAAKNDGCASYLLQAGGEYYLIDVGPGALSYLQNYIDYTKINAIFVSHLHADHISDIYTLRFAFYYAQGLNRMKKPIEIMMPGSPIDTYNYIESTIKDELFIKTIGDGDSVRINNMDISFLKVEHPVETYAMRFDTDEGSFVYTADTSYFDRLVEFSNGAGLLLADATFIEADKDKEYTGHMTAKTAAKLAKEAEARQLVLTHIWPENDRLTVLKEAEEIYKNVIIAERGERHIVQ